MDTRELIQSIIASEEDAGDKFLESMEERISDALEVRKVELASGMMDEADGSGAKWRQGYHASGHPSGYKHKDGQVGPIGGTYTNEPKGYDGTYKRPVAKYRDENDPLSRRFMAGTSAKGTPLSTRAKNRNLKYAMRYAQGKHGPVNKLPEEVGQVDEALESEFKDLGKRRNDTGRELEDADYQEHTYKVPKGLKPKFAKPSNAERHRFMKKYAFKTGKKIPGYNAPGKDLMGKEWKAKNEEVEQVDEASKPNLKMSNYPHFQEYAAGALRARGEGAPKHDTEIHHSVKSHLDRAENELKAAKQKGHNLSQLGADADEGKHSGFKHAYKMLGKAYYNFEEVEQVNEVSGSMLKNRYISAARKDRSAAMDRQSLRSREKDDYDDNPDPDDDKDSERIAKRERGIRLANAKTNKSGTSREFNHYAPVTAKVKAPYDPRAQVKPRIKEDVEQANEAITDMEKLRLMGDKNRALTMMAMKRFQQVGDINKLSPAHRTLVTKYMQNQAGSLERVSSGMQRAVLKQPKE